MQSVRKSVEELEYGYLDPLVGTRNYGDAIIDRATRHMLEGVLPEPAERISLFGTDKPRPGLDFLLAPGVTTLTDGDRPFMSMLGQLDCPTYCLAGNLWAPMPKRGLLVRTRVLFADEQAIPSLAVPEQLAAPVGVRDSFTHKLLDNAGIENVYAGCPTIHLPTDGVGDDGYLLFSFGRANVRRQLFAARQLERHMPVIGLCHEPHDRERYLAAGCRFPLIEYDGDVELYLSYIKRARMVVTGRLHGALPATAYRKPVFYFGTVDSRTSILEDLGIRIHSWDGISKALDRATPACNRTLVSTFKARWAEMLAGIVGRHTT